MVLVKAIEIDYGKVIDHPLGFFIPNKFESTANICTKDKKTGGQLCFYLINDNQELITCQRSEGRFTSDDEYFIKIGLGMDIQNDRSKDDYACLWHSDWSGIS